MCERDKRDGDPAPVEDEKPCVVSGEALDQFLKNSGLVDVGLPASEAIPWGSFPGGK